MNYLIVLMLLFKLTLSSPVTFELKAGEKEWFHILTSDIDCIITYYFAVQQGDDNDFNIEYQIFGPGNKYSPLIDIPKQSQGEWSFPAEHKGEYSFCFYGGESHNKIVDLEISHVCKAESPSKIGRKSNKQELNSLSKNYDQLEDLLDDSIDTIERQLHILDKNIQYYKIRNNRNQYTVSSTEQRIVWFSIYGILLIVGMSFIQIITLQVAFNKRRVNTV